MNRQSVYPLSSLGSLSCQVSATYCFFRLPTSSSSSQSCSQAAAIFSNCLRFSGLFSVRAMSRNCLARSRHFSGVICSSSDMLDCSHRVTNGTSRRVSKISETVAAVGPGVAVPRTADLQIGQASTRPPTSGGLLLAPSASLPLPFGLARAHQSRPTCDVPVPH
jgi:hypothetical protein